MPKNVSSTITADQHNDTRRRRKAAQKANARSGKGARTSLQGTYFGEMMEENRARRAAADARRERQRSVITPRDAALKATEAPCLDSLTGIALLVAVGTIEAYASITPKGGMGRTKAAFEAAKADLSDEDARCHVAVSLGYRKTRDALDWAYAQIRTERGVESTVS